MSPWVSITACDATMVATVANWKRSRTSVSWPPTSLRTAAVEASVKDGAPGRMGSSKPVVAAVTRAVIMALRSTERAGIVDDIDFPSL